jgi:hypothetical protein
MKALVSWLVGAVAIAALVYVGFSIGHAYSQSVAKYGVALPQGPALFETSLQSRISSTDTSMTLVANSVRGGSSLSGYQCFTLDEGRTDAEFVCGSISGTSVTSLERGIDALTGTSTNSVLKFAHRVGANVKVTDFPLIARLRNQANGIETFPNLLTYTNTVLIGVGSPTTTIATKYYVDNVVTGGAANADDTTKGLVETATAAEAAAGTSLGSTGARLALPASIANATPSATTLVPITSAAGKLAQGFLDLTQTFSPSALWTFSAGLLGTASSTFVATTSINASNVLGNALILNGIKYAFPSQLGASSTVLSTDANGKLTWETAPSAIVSTSTTFALPTGNGTTVTQTVYCVAPKLVAGGGYSGLSEGSSGAAVNVHVAINNYPDSASSWTVTVGCNLTTGSCSAGTGTVYARCVNP